MLFEELGFLVFGDALYHSAVAAGAYFSSASLISHVTEAEKGAVLKSGLAKPSSDRHTLPQIDLCGSVGWSLLGKHHLSHELGQCSPTKLQNLPDKKCNFCHLSF